MESDTIFLYIIAVAALCSALINGMCFLLKRNKSAQTTGVITSVKMPNPETSKARNSKWAKVSRIIVSLIIAAICIIAAVFKLV